ncbi:unnamed protein product [Gadus morhua 'NCC']
MLVWVLVWRLEFRVLESGRWSVDAGAWVMERGCWSVGAGGWVLEGGCWRGASGLDESISIMKPRLIAVSFPRRPLNLP